MTKKTRYFMLGAAGIVVAGLCTGLVAYYGILPGGFLQAAAGTSELSYMPADASMVAYANVRDVMSSDLRQRMQAIAPDGNKNREWFQGQTGINLETDVDSVVAGMVPREDRTEGVAIIRGRFDAVRLEAFARERGGVIGEYQGIRLIERQGSEEHGTLAFLEPGLLAAGGNAAVRAAIDCHREGGRNVTANAELMKLVGEIEGNSNAWAVGRFDALANRAKLPDNIASQIPAIQWFSASGRVNGGVTGLFRAETRDDQSAANLRDVVRGFLALARLQAGSKPEFQTLLESLELGGTGRTVALSFTIPSQVFESFAPQMRQRAEQP